MEPFETIGPVARWRVIYDLLTEVPVNGVLTYEKMGEALELDPARERTTIQASMTKASRRLEENNLHAVEPVINVGYRVVEVPEHLRLARGQQRKASRALARGRSKVVNVDLRGLDPEVRRAFEAVAIVFSMQMDFNRRMDAGQKRLAAAVAATTVRADRSEEEIASIKQQLVEMEQRIEAVRASTISE